ncbi:hypothetical protein C8Q76DRAFT_699462 [Earliella scabrosa]|nr:hypothetical protein C8Q76DRAFT_699462 [Earliella scabrosa]
MLAPRSLTSLVRVQVKVGRLTNFHPERTVLVTSESGRAPVLGPPSISGVGGAYVQHRDSNHRIGASEQNEEPHTSNRLRQIVWLSLSLRTHNGSIRPRPVLLRRHVSQHPAPVVSDAPKWLLHARSPRGARDKGDKIETFPALLRSQHVTPQSFDYALRRMRQARLSPHGDESLQLEGCSTSARLGVNTLYVTSTNPPKLTSCKRTSGAGWAGRKKQPAAVVPENPRAMQVWTRKKFHPFARVFKPTRISALEGTLSALKNKAVLYRYDVDGSDDDDNATGEGNDASGEASVPYLRAYVLYQRDGRGQGHPPSTRGFQTTTRTPPRRFLVTYDFHPTFEPRPFEDKSVKPNVPTAADLATIANTARYYNQRVSKSPQYQLVQLVWLLRYDINTT